MKFLHCHFMYRESYFKDFAKWLECSLVHQKKLSNVHAVYAVKMEALQ